MENTERRKRRNYTWPVEAWEDLYRRTSKRHSSPSFYRLRRTWTQDSASNPQFRWNPFSSRRRRRFFRRHRAGQGGAPSLQSQLSFPFSNSSLHNFSLSFSLGMKCWKRSGYGGWGENRGKVWNYKVGYGKNII